MPPDIQEIESLVNRMSLTIRQPIMVVYAKPGPLWLKAFQIGISKSTLKRRLNHAEIWIDKELK